MALRVLVDATAVPADRGALGRYVDGLIAALHRVGADLAVACQRSDEERYATLAPGAQVVAGPTAIGHRPTRLAWEQTGLPFVAQQVGAQVIHSPDYSTPQRPVVPTVVTIHDVTYFSEPEAHNPVRATYIKSATRTAVRRATRLIVPSKATRDELVRLLGADPTRIDVAYHGVDQAIFHPPTDDERRRQVSERLGLHGHPYIAFLGALEPRKNVPNLIRGWVQAVADLAEAAGAGAGRRRRLGRRGRRRAGRRCRPTCAVLRPGYLRCPHLPGFFGGALVVALPSRGEGFGLAGARGDGLWRAGADHAPVVAARGGR